VSTRWITLPTRTFTPALHCCSRCVFVVSPMQTWSIQYLTSHNCKQSCQLRTFALRHSPPATRVSPTSRLTLLCHPILVFVDDFAYAFLRNFEEILPAIDAFLRARTHIRFVSALCFRSYDRSHNVRPKRNIRQAMQHGTQLSTAHSPYSLEIESHTTARRIAHSCPQMSCFRRDLDVRHLPEGG
jgi:hypothetical protein